MWHALLDHFRDRVRERREHDRLVANPDAWSSEFYETIWMTGWIIAWGRPWAFARKDRDDALLGIVVRTIAVGPLRFRRWRSKPRFTGRDVS